MAFNFLNNASSYKKICSFKDLAVGDYIVTEFSFSETKFGKKVLIDIGDRLVCLPPRYSAMSQEYMDELNSSRVIMHYRGKDSSKNNK